MELTYKLNTQIFSPLVKYKLHSYTSELKECKSYNIVSNTTPVVLTYTSAIDILVQAVSSNIVTSSDIYTTDEYIYSEAIHLSNRDHIIEYYKYRSQYIVDNILEILEQFRIMLSTFNITYNADVKVTSEEFLLLLKYIYDNKFTNTNKINEISYTVINPYYQLQYNKEGFIFYNGR